jgi:hypothetical protein
VAAAVGAPVTAGGGSAGRLQQWGAGGGGGPIRKGGREGREREAEGGASNVPQPPACRPRASRPNPLWPNPLWPNPLNPFSRPPTCLPATPRARRRTVCVRTVRVPGHAG